MVLVQKRKRVRLRLPGIISAYLRLSPPICPPERGLLVYYKLCKAELVQLLEKNIKKSRTIQINPVRRVTILHKPENMDVFEEPEIAKNGSVVKIKFNECMV